MHDTTIFTLDSEAINFGGKKGGLYLDMLGKTDLAALSLGEWREFLTYVVEGAWRFGLDRHIAKVEAKTPSGGGPITNDEIPF